MSPVGLCRHQAFVGQHRLQIEDAVFVDAIAGADLLRSLQSEGPGEHRQAAKQRAFGDRQQLVAPGQRGPERLLAIQRRSAAGRQHREAVAESLGDLSRRERPHARRGELERERHSIQPEADLGHRPGVVLAQRKARATSLARSQNTGSTRSRPAPRARPTRPGGQRERRTARSLLRGRAALAARDQDPQPGASAQQVLGKDGAGADQVLAVVQDQQRAPPSELAPRPSRAGSRDGRVSPSAEAVASATNQGH
jgi:hypothetical protein